MYIVIEGNIGAGKSTLMEELNRRFNVPIIPEPLDKWTAGDNLLMQYYTDPKPHCFRFQETVSNTIRVDQCYINSVVERSPYSTYHVFTQLARRKGHLGDDEYARLTTLYRTTVQTQ